MALYKCCIIIIIICVILRLAVLIQYRSVTDTHTHTHTDTRRRHIPCLARRRAVKTATVAGYFTLLGPFYSYSYSWLRLILVVVSTVATPGEWQCKIRTGGVQRLAVANGPNIIQMLLVLIY